MVELSRNDGTFQALHTYALDCISHRTHIVVVTTVVDDCFEWDDAKDALNVSKHGVTFAEAVTAFDDPNAPVQPDGGSGWNLVLIGFSIRARLLTVVHEDLPHPPGRIRIISAWLSTPAERREYAGGDTP